MGIPYLNLPPLRQISNPGGPEAVAEGGYGADSAVAPAAVGAGEQIMNNALIWTYQMLGKIK